MPLLPFRSRIRALVLVAVLFSALAGGCARFEPRPERVEDPAVPSSRASAQPAPSAADPSKTAASGISPPFFRVEGRGGARLEILGTIHLGPATGWQFASTISRAMREADAFMLEIDLRALDENRVGDLLAALVILPPGTTLDEVVSPETAKLLDEHDASLARIGFPRNARRHKKPWYLVTSIISIDSQKSGYDLSQSVENAILAVAGDRPVLALETFESQLRLMDAMSPKIQDIMLRDTLERRHDSTREIKKLVEAWTRNDQATLADIAYQGVDEFPELADFYDALLKDRNRNWAMQLGEILDDPRRAGESIFVGVGALHLVGPDNLISLLRSSGYDVQTVHPSSSN